MWVASCFLYFPTSIVETIFSLSSPPNGNSTEVFKPQYKVEFGFVVEFFPFSFPPLPCHLKLGRSIKLAKFYTAALSSLQCHELSQRPHHKTWLIGKDCSYRKRCHIFCAFHGLREPETRRPRAESPRLSPLGHELALQEAEQRFFHGLCCCCGWSTFLLLSVCVCSCVSGAAGSSPALWSDLINHSISCSAEANEIW